jgi:hypothetical protein
VQVDGFGALMPRHERYMTHGRNNMPPLVQGGKDPPSSIAAVATSAFLPLVRLRH